MNIVLAIFRKDARRFWWEITITIGVLAALAWQDINRYDYIPGQVESLLNLLLGAAWAYLVAIAIQEEPLVGDRQFWLTCPIPWALLVSEKVLFALAFVHLPALVADVVILTAHGFQPLAWLPQLAWKQVIVAAIVTIPSAALATITRNVAQFAVAGFVIVAAALLLAGGEPRYPWLPPEPLHHGLPVAVLALCAACVVAIQYRVRRTSAAWILWSAGLLAAGGLHAYLPEEMDTKWRDKVPAMALVLAPEREKSSPPIRAFPNSHEFAIPVRLTGLHPEDNLSFRGRGVLEVTSANGRVWRIPPFPSTPRRQLPTTGIFFLADGSASGPTSLDVISTEPLFSGLAGQTVRIRGSLTVDVTRTRASGSMRIGERKEMAGVGQCSTAFTQAALRNGDQLKVLCESPALSPPTAWIELGSSLRPGPWKQHLGDGMKAIPYFWTAWLSPIERRQTYFHIVDEESNVPGSRWTVWRRALNDATLNFSRETPIEFYSVDFDLPNIRVSDYLLDEHQLPPNIRR